MRRACVLVLFALASAATSATAQTAAEVISAIERESGVPSRENTVDTFKAGDPATRVKGIAVTMMATFDVLQRAAARGHNLIITHEPTFYSHRDLVDALRAENDAVLAAKEKFIADNGLVILRFHDRPHAMDGDRIRTGMLRAMGWENRRSASSPLVVELERMRVPDLARQLETKLNANAVRIVGDTTAMASRIGFTQGFPGFAANRSAIQAGIDVLVMGEDHEWETIAYAADAIAGRKLKAVIVIGHTPSEQEGMSEVARWLRTFITTVPVEMIPARDPFMPLR